MVSKCWPFISYKNVIGRAPTNIMKCSLAYLIATAALTIASGATSILAILARHQILHGTVKMTTERLANTIHRAETETTKALNSVACRITSVATKRESMTNRAVKTTKNTAALAS